MNSHKPTRKIVPLSIAVLLGMVASSQADWFPGDSYKMHYPQLPDPNGWDVNFVRPKVLADDWLCTETGPVSDIHFWYSFNFDQPVPIESIHLSIHSDIPASPTGAFSRPGELLWSRDLVPGEWLDLYPYPGASGSQGWYDPNTGLVIPDNHQLTGQINVRIPEAEAFIQKEGTIYWLDISILSPVSGTTAGIGWKTTKDHFNDDAVWGDFTDTGDVVWNELRDPTTQESLDLAFVITTVPEPNAILLSTLGGSLLLVWRRRLASH